MGGAIIYCKINHQKGDIVGINKIFQTIDGILTWIISLILMILVVVDFTAVLARTVLQASLIWADEFLRYSFIWMVFLGGALAIRKRSHITVNLAPMLFPSRWHRSIFILSSLFILIFATSLLVISFEYVTQGFGQVSTAMQIPMAWVYLCIPISMILVVIGCLRLIVTEITGHRSMS